MSFLDGISPYYLPIKGFPDYLISKNGEVWSKHVKRILTPWKVNSGHLQTRMRQGSRAYARYIHRLVLETFVGPCPPGMECCHNNGDPADNRLENLRWGTRKDNILDSVRHGTHFSRGRAKLNSFQVHIIKRLIEFGRLTQQEIADIFNVTKQNIWRIKHNQIWKIV